MVTNFQLPFDEMILDDLDRNFKNPNLSREHYKSFAQWLNTQGEDVLKGKREEADLMFRRVGITFAVYGDSGGTERTIPFDIVPRIFTAQEWQKLEKGLIQRVTALNMFLHDVYH
jgi:uncharacterized circularly permuted ATP-grasp superfamily protein